MPLLYMVGRKFCMIIRKVLPQLLVFNLALRKYNINFVVNVLNTLSVKISCVWLNPIIIFPCLTDTTMVKEVITLLR